MTATLRVIIFAFALTCLLVVVFLNRDDSFRPRAIVIHESASQWGDVQSIREWHISRGWDDIGYHAVILNSRRTKESRYIAALDGKIEPGRPEDCRGIHCEADDMNSKALGVCLVGDPRHAGYPTKRQIDSLIHYCATKCREHRIPVSAITQHSDHDPRKPLDASLDMDEIRRMVQARLAER